MAQWLEHWASCVQGKSVVSFACSIPMAARVIQYSLRMLISHGVLMDITLSRNAYMMA